MGNGYVNPWPAAKSRGKLLFSDTMQNAIFSWSPISGIQLELEDAVVLSDDQRNSLVEPGPNGLLQQILYHLLEP